MYSASNTRPFICSEAGKIHTGRCGKPSYDVHEGQLNFLLEQGFKVSGMMGVSKRTLERRMHLFDISVTGNTEVTELNRLCYMVKKHGLIIEYPDMYYYRMP